MRFLADESCDMAVVRALQGAGYDVVCISEMIPGAEDSEVIKCACSQRSILLTEDKDFGRLVYAYGKKTSGVIFLRYPISAREQIAKEVVELVKRERERLNGCFITVQTGKIRIARIPEG